MTTANDNNNNDNDDNPSVEVPYRTILTKMSEGDEEGAAAADDDADQASAHFLAMKKFSAAVIASGSMGTPAAPDAEDGEGTEGGGESLNTSARPTSVRWCPDPEVGYGEDHQEHPFQKGVNGGGGGNGVSNIGNRRISGLTAPPGDDDDHADQHDDETEDEGERAGARTRQGAGGQSRMSDGGKSFASAVSNFMRLRRNAAPDTTDASIAAQSAATGATGTTKHFGYITTGAMGRRNSNPNSLHQNMLRGQYDGGSFSVKRAHRDELNIESLRRKEYEKVPMPKWERRKLKFQKWFVRNSAGEDGSSGKVGGASSSSLNASSSSLGVQKSTQIHVPPSEHAGFLKGMSHAFHLSFHDLIVWQINTSYMYFFTFILVWYLIWCNLFALILYGAIDFTYDYGKPIECITTYKFENFENSHPTADFHQNMEYAFELSWTTFSTVGYGAISPSGGNSGCYLIRYICAIEAFVGVIYFGFSGAIFFAKINRILQRAPVVFSSTLCVQYDVKAAQAPQASPEVSMPFPVLEFRIVNNKSNFKGWEILEAELKCMVSIDLQDESPPTNNNNNNTAPVHMRSTTRDQSELFHIDIAGENNHIDVPVSKQTFHKLRLEAESHPYFKRVWYCRHVLNDQSPLVRREVRREIRDSCGGRFWPHDKSSHANIRASLVKFNTIITTMKGTLNITSNGVFIEKRYKFEDICIGYKFAGLLYLSDSRTAKGEKKVKIDLALVHDIVPQPGGGNEPLGKGSGAARILTRTRRKSRHTRQNSGLKVSV